MKFKSKRELRRENASLRAELRSMKRIADAVRNTMLPKCESTLCRSCANAVWDTGDLFTGPVLLGCRKDIQCRDFMPQTTIVLLSSSRQ